MILSASRRTDIPAFFADWFFERLKDGFYLVRNPLNAHQVSRVEISEKIVDCIVFWSKNPRPMLNRLHEADNYKYYFQYTVNGYAYDAEPNLPSLAERLDTFDMLSERIGRERVIWRYDPIIFSRKYDPDFHLECFEYIAKRLSGKAKKCVFSLVDVYPSKNKKNLSELGYHELNTKELEAFIGKLSAAAQKYGLTLASCAEKADLSKFGIEHNSCIDRALIEEICGYRINARQDGQRAECGCVKCEEMGAYDTCLHGCVYCYANYRNDIVRKRYEKYDPFSPMLCDELLPDDKITVRDVRSLRMPEEKNDDQSFEQLKLF